MFACTNQHSISVYKFYTAENPPELTFKSHIGKVRCIHWFENDSGFVSGGWDGNVYIWSIKDNQKPMFEHKVKNVNFSCVARVPESNITYIVGTDKSIKEIDNGTEKLRYEAGVNVSQVALMHGGRALFAGVAEEDRPGSI